MKKKIEELKKCKNDVERWKWIFENKDLDFTVMLDNDNTFIVFNIDEDDNYVSLDCYLGNSEGVECVLDTVGIKNEGV